MTAYSVSPSGEKFPIPSEADYAKEMARLQGSGRSGPARGQGSRRRDGRGLRRRGDGGDHRRHGRQEDRQAEQVRHRLPAAQPAQLLEDPAAQPRRVAGEGRGPRGRSDDRPLREREEDARGHLQQRLPGAGRLRGGRRAVRLHQARPGQHAHRRGRDERPGGDDADHRREDPAALPDADRDDRGPGHDGVRRLADHEEGLRRPRHRRPSRCWPTASSA